MKIFPKEPSLGKPAPQILEDTPDHHPHIKYVQSKFQPMSSSSYSRKTGNGNTKYSETEIEDLNSEWNLREQLSILTYNFIQFVINVASQLKIIPIQRISNDSLRISRFGNRRSNLCYWLAALQLLGYWFYLTVTFFQEFLSNKISQKLTAKSAVHLLKMAIYGIAASFQGTLIWKQEQAVKVINGVDSVYQYFQRRGVECEPWWSSVFTIFPFLYLAFLTIIIPPFFSFLFFFDPNNVMFFFSIAPNFIRDSTMAQAAFGIFEFYSSVSIMMTIIFVMIEVWGFVLSTTHWLQLLMRDLPDQCDPPRQTVNTMKVFYMRPLKQDVTSKMELYKLLKILTIFHNEFVYLLASSATVVYCGAVTLCIYACMIAHAVLPVHIYILFPVVVSIMIFFIFVTYGEVAQIFLFSSKCLNTFKTEIQHCSKLSIKSQLQYKEWKSLSPFGVHLLTGYFDICTPQQMMEQIFSFVILLLQL